MLNDRKKKYHMDNIHPLSNSTKDQYLLRPATLWGIPYVKEALYIFEEQYPHEVRLSQSLNVAIQYAQGEKRGQNLRRLHSKLVKKFPQKQNLFQKQLLQSPLFHTHIPIYIQVNKDGDRHVTFLAQLFIQHMHWNCFKETQI